jgi:hypothetical protein
MLAGIFIVVAGYRRPQRIIVRKVGDSYTFTWTDSRGINRVFESDLIGFGVSVFKERGGGQRRFTIKGRWDEVFYRDHSGQIHEVKIHEDQEID